MKTSIDVYRYWDNWVFNEHGVCEREPFVLGSTEIITQIATDNGIKNLKNKKLSITFSDAEFKGYQDKLQWAHASSNGNWYKLKSNGMEGWLCPMLLHYFETPPKEIYVSIIEKTPLI